ncbi:M23 family metallopeptidase [Pseudaestuariivita sp.]|uniref:M23 family metallopeptidase n=1 Tax=Pseudaestuariivita sp. TaxID=2211669 RepID=UPI00405932B1
MTLRGLTALALICAASTGAAQTPSEHTITLTWPVECVPGETCFVEDYMDRDPAPGAYQDFACGLNARDGHRGTDIALFDWTSDVAVVAAAPGRVAATRDGMVDDWRMPGVTDSNACGNAVRIAHADGYQTLYCHLKEGSLAVEDGQTVEAGDELGLIGVSGMTTHPHLHFALLQNGDLVDPYDPLGEARCDASAETLWESAPPYDQTILRLAGFATSVPDYDALRSGSARLETASPGDPLVVYVEAGYAEHGDVVTIRAEGPEGEIFSHSRVMKSPRVSQLPAFGKRAPEGGWPVGDYTGQITLTRQGRIVANRWAHVTVVER